MPSKHNSEFDEQSVHSRLASIATQWSLLEKAHSEELNEWQKAVSRMMMRYRTAVFRYLLAVLKNQDAAEDVFQEFAVRFLKGDYRGADPERGRFRDYLKRSLCNLVTDYYRQNKKRERQLDSEYLPTVVDTTVERKSFEAQFDASWRDELLSRAWGRLENYQDRKKTPYFTVLRIRSEFPKASTSELVSLVGQQIPLESILSETGFRKILQRARERFASFLIEEIESTMQSHDPSEVEEELISLKLLHYCKPKGS